MENLRPTFLSKEQQEDLQFYKGWVRDALLHGLVDAEAYKNARDSVHAVAQIADAGVDIDFALLNQFEQQMDTRLQTTLQEVADELQRKVFKDKLFRVAIVVDDEPVEVENIIVFQEQLVPQVDGNPYVHQFSDVVFDR